MSITGTLVPSFSVPPVGVQVSPAGVFTHRNRYSFEERGTFSPRPWRQHLSHIARTFPLARPASAVLAMRPVHERYGGSGGTAGSRKNNGRRSLQPAHKYGPESHRVTECPLKSKEV